MTLRLIKEAQAKSTLTPESLRMLEVVKNALGKTSITAVMEESYTPTPEEYVQWLDVIQGYARDAGINIRKKAAFEEVAHSMLDSVDEMPYSMKEPVVNKLWLDAQAQKHLKKVAGVAQAAEDEERVAQAARTMVGDDEPVDGEMDASLDDNFDDQLDGTTDDESFEDSFDRDTQPSSDTSSEQAWWHDDEDDTDEAAFPKFAAGNGDRPNDLAGTPEEDDFDPAAEDYNSAFGTRPPPAFENEEKTSTAPKKMSVLQQMLTLPKNSINSLVKDVESEGAAAWSQHVLPQNPHPKGSMAHKAWERGMTKAMKDHVGGGKETTKPAAKKKTRR